jgi:hypothetical protein
MLEAKYENVGRGLLPITNSKMVSLWWKDFGEVRSEKRSGWGLDLRGVY